MKNKVKILDAASMVLLLLLSVVFIFPFYWILTGAFKSQKVTIKLPPEWFPLHPTLENFEKLFQNPALQWLINSIFIAGVTLIKEKHWKELMVVITTIYSVVGRRLGHLIFQNT